MWFYLSHEYVTFNYTVFFLEFLTCPHCCRESQIALSRHLNTTWNHWSIRLFPNSVGLLSNRFWTGVGLVAECQNKGWGLSANVCPPLQSTLGPIERSNPLEILNGKEEPGVELAERGGNCLSGWKKLETTAFNNWVTTICSIGEEAEHFGCVKYNWSWMWPSWKDAMVEDKEDKGSLSNLDQANLNAQHDLLRERATQVFRKWVGETN